jgi:acyl dehydratase
MPATVRGLFFEDMSIGDVFVTGSRTITTTDIVNFSCLSGDFNEVHSNWEYCRTTPFGEPIAHGPLVYAIAAGLAYASGINEGSLIALLEIKSWRMLVPVKNGDTIRLDQEVIEVRPTSKGDKGIVTFERRIINQREEAVQQMVASYLYRSRSGVSTAASSQP